MNEWPYECIDCGHLVDWDDKLGWFHDEHAVFDHDARVELEPAQFDGSSPPLASADGSARGGEEAVPRFSDPAPGCDHSDGSGGGE